MPLWLHEPVNIPEFFNPYVSDVKINVFEIAYLTYEYEQLRYFHSDFKAAADYFIRKQRKGDYVPGREQLNHVEAVLRLLSVMTGDSRFEDVPNQEDGSEGGVKNMCDVPDRAEAGGER